MITLYKDTETDFIHNGIGILSECKNAQVYREKNGKWELELDYPVFDKKELYLELKKDNIIKCPTPKGLQLFRIVRAELSLTIVHVYAQHIFYDLTRNFIPNTNIVGKTRVEAVQQLLNSTMSEHPFSAIGDATAYQYNARIVRKTPIQAILSEDDNSILTRWGGEFDFDNFIINVKERIGEDKGVLIAYKKNLTGLRESLDYSTIGTRIIPQGFDGMFLPEYYIDSPYIGNYYQPFIQLVEFPEIKVRDEEGDGTADTPEGAYQQLRDGVQALFKKGLDTPIFNYEVNFIQLSKTQEYANYKVLEDVQLGDTVTIKHQGLGIDLKGRVVSYSYDPLRDKYDSVNIGTTKKDITLSINTAFAKVNFMSQKIDLAVTSMDEKLQSSITVLENEVNLKVSNLEDNVQSSIEVFEDEIALKVDKNGVISAINLSEETIKISADKIDITGFVTFSDLSTSGESTISGDNITTGAIKSNNYVVNSTGMKINLLDGTIDSKLFKVSSSGKLTVTDGYFAGEINANSGEIAGFTIGEDYLMSADETVGFGTTADWAFWAGGATESTARFRVKRNGQMVLRADSGTSPLTIYDRSNSSNYIVFDTNRLQFVRNGTPNITLLATSTGNMLLGGDLHCKDIYIDDPWVNGWGLVQMLKDLYSKLP